MKGYSKGKGNYLQLIAHTVDIYKTKDIRTGKKNCLQKLSYNNRKYQLFYA